MIKFRVFNKAVGFYHNNFVKEMLVRKDNKNDCFIIKGYDNCQVIEQFTGLQDNNGKDVYEGDIVSFYEVLGQTGLREPFEGVVKCGKGYYYVEYIKERNKKGRWNLSSCWHLIVVGNVHDNKEFYNN